MANPINMDDSSDSEDLQALFDSIAAGAPPTPTPPKPDHVESMGDSDDLQALFDTVAQSQSATTSAAAEASDQPDSPDTQEQVFNRLGHLARQLHDSLRGLGYDRMLEDTARQIPDARQRLTYIAQMTEQAASRVLNATDIAKPHQDYLIAQTTGLSARWDKMFANQLSVDEFKQLATDTRAYFHESPGRLKVTNDQLMDIMMAQDFQDLTGQVIKKVVEMAQGLETQLLDVLIAAMPERKRMQQVSEGLMNGPVINAEGRTDVITDQSQVDDLLESLGF